MAKTGVWLASASERRRALLLELLEGKQIWFTSSSLKAEESIPETNLQVSEKVNQVATSKANAALIESNSIDIFDYDWKWLGEEKEIIEKPNSLESIIVIVADTLVEDPDEPLASLGQPQDKLAAVSMLLRLSGRRHKVWSATALICPIDGIIINHLSSAIVEFVELSDADISHLIINESWVGKAGSYDLAGEAGKYAKLVEGDELSVLGLSPSAVDGLLQRIKDLS